MANERLGFLGQAIDIGTYGPSLTEADLLDDKVGIYSVNTGGNTSVVPFGWGVLIKLSVPGGYGAVIFICASIAEIFFRTTHVNGEGKRVFYCGWKEVTSTVGA